MIHYRCDICNARFQWVERDGSEVLIDVMKSHMKEWHPERAYDGSAKFSKLGNPPIWATDLPTKQFGQYTGLDIEKMNVHEVPTIRHDEEPSDQLSSIEQLVSELVELNDEIMVLINRRNAKRENLEILREKMNKRIDIINTAQYEFEYSQVHGGGEVAQEETKRF